jgi:hypothetical protein
LQLHRAKQKRHKRITRRVALHACHQLCPMGDYENIRLPAVIGTKHVAFLLSPGATSSNIDFLSSIIGKLSVNYR